MSTVANLLCGAYDLHSHPIPSHAPRSLDDFELIEQATAAGMAGVMIKNHYEPTAARAILANRRAKEGSAVAYGAVVLNCTVGGLNAYAARSALHMGAKLVYMPTRDAKNALVNGPQPGDFFDREGITVFREDGSLVDEVYSIFDAVKDYNGCLGTAHLSADESLALCKAGTARGVRMMLTHPEWEDVNVSLEFQLEMADMGVYIEKCWFNVSEGSCTIEEMADHIRKIGAHRCFMTTDRGQLGRGYPVDEMKEFIRQLLEQGISEAEIKTMLVDVPKKVLGIE